MGKKETNSQKANVKQLKLASRLLEAKKIARTIARSAKIFVGFSLTVSYYNFN